MKKAISAVLALALATSSAVAITGCVSPKAPANNQENNQASTSQTQSENALQPIIKDSAYTIKDGYVYCTVAVENPNLNSEPSYTQLLITGTDKDGSIAFSNDYSLSSLPRGEVSYYSTMVGTGSTKQDTEVTFDIAKVGNDELDWKVPQDFSRNDCYKLDKVSFKQSSWDKKSGSVTGTVTYTEQEDNERMESPQLTAIVFDKDGKIKSGRSTTITSNLTPNKPTSFEIFDVDKPGEDDRIEVFAVSGSY